MPKKRDGSPPDPALAARVSAMVAAIGGTRRELAEHSLGVSERTLAGYMRAENSPTLDVVVKLARLSGRDLVWAVTGQGTAEVPSRLRLDLETIRRVNALNERVAKLYASQEQVHALEAQHRAAEEYAASVGIPLDDMDDEQLDRAYGLVEAAEKARRVLERATQPSPGSDTPAATTTIRRKRPA